MDLLHWVLFGVLPALGAMLLGVGAGGSRFLALALAVAVAVPFAMAGGAPPWPWQLDPNHGEPRTWWFWLVLVSGLIGSLGDARWLPRQLALVLEIVLAGSLPWLLTGLSRRGWSFEQHVLWLTAGALVVYVLWHVLREAGRARPGLLVPFVGAMALGVDAWFLRAHGVPTWELAGVAATALLFALGTAAWRRPLTSGTGACLCLVVVHVGCLWCGRALRDMHSLSTVLALLQPLPLWFALCSRFARQPKLGMTLALFGCLGLGAAVVWRG